MNDTVITFCFMVFFFNDTATTEIYTLSLHDALPISKKFSDHLLQLGVGEHLMHQSHGERLRCRIAPAEKHDLPRARSEEHTSELQSQSNLVCRLLLAKKKSDYIPRSLSARCCILTSH